jgi:ribonucleotide reductase beta subunit family protein with ferritin-like domain
MSSAPPTLVADQISYETLYERWEHGNWRATEIDFSTDREQWHGTFSEVERRSAMWIYSMFFHGEDSVAENLSPFIDAAPREEQKYFLTTQQVDEARHAVLFGRFMREVAEAAPDTAGALAATRPHLTWGFRKVFERLDQMAVELRRDRSRPKLAQAITLYHLVIEASLAQPGQHLIDDSLSRRNLLPGLSEGVRNVARDEQRHIAFGVKMIADLIREDPECQPAVEELLREILPYMTAVFVPPNWDESYVECFGFTLEDVYTHGAESMDGRLRAAGMKLEEMRVGLPFDLSPRERARRGLTLLRAGYLGEPNGKVTPDPEATQMLFDGLRRQIDTSAAPEATIQWEFTDAPPWHVRIEGGSASATPGKAEHADLTFRCRFEDWIDLAAGRIEPWRALALRKIRPSGSLRMLARAPKLFAA